MQYKSKRFRDNIFVHIHECLVSRQAVVLNIKLISIITAYILSYDQFLWKPNSWEISAVEFQHLSQK
jgi:hypothetical protein